MMLRSRTNMNTNNSTSNNDIKAFLQEAEKEENEAISKSNKPENHNNETTTKPKSKLSCFIIEAIVISSLGGVLFGYDLGIISNALPEISKTFILTTIQKENIVSFLYIGGIFGACIGGILCDKIGRKKCILLTDIIFGFGSILIYRSTTYEEIIIGRFILGFGISTSGIADVSYLHEISPTVDLRGALVSCNEACISLGFLVSYVVGYVIINHFPSNEGWRLMFGISCLIAILQFVGMCFMPESPKWLISRGRVDEANRVMIRIHGSPYDNIDEDEGKISQDNDVDDDITTLTTESSIDENTSLLSKNNKLKSKSKVKTSSANILQTIINTYKEFQNNIPQVFIALFLSMSQQFSGHHNVLNFATDIFTEGSSTKTVTIDHDNSNIITTSSESISTASLMTLILGIVKFVTTIIIIFKIESVGRRTLLLCGIFCMCLCHLLLGITLSLYYSNDDDNMRLCLLLIGTVGVVTGYASSYGPLTWLLTSEMFPTTIRGRALGISTILNYITASILSYAFLSVQESFHNISIPFYMYSLTCFISLVFCYIAIPNIVGGEETTCDSIDKDIREMKFWKFMIDKYYYLYSILFLRNGEDNDMDGSKKGCFRCWTKNDDEDCLQLLDVS